MTFAAAMPALQSSLADGRLSLVASGHWTARHASELDALVQGITRQPAGIVNSVLIDFRNLQAFDTFGAWLLTRVTREYAARGWDCQVSGLSPEQTRLYDAVQRTAPAGYSDPKRRGRAARTLAAFTDGMSGLGSDVGGFLSMLGNFAATLLRIVRHPGRFRLTSTVHQLDRIGWGAVPIIALITFLIGGIIAQQGFFHFRKFGADAYVVDMVGILVLREIGVLIVAIMVAGRSGSAYTAELGSMRMREEIDALRTMGFDPVEVLVVPRVVALVVALPILAFLGSMAALYGGAVIASTYGGMSFDVFVVRLKEAVSITHFKVGMIKAPFMALVIGIVACSEGMKVRGSAESLGQHTTSSVVKSIFLVIVLDGLFAVFFASIGM